LRFFLGYSRDTQSGPALTTVQLYDARGDEYPLFENLKREQNEYRLGGEAKVAGFRLNVLRGWTDYKEESPISRTTVSQGANTDDFNQLNLLTRTEPYHGTSPYWRGSLMRDGRRWSVSGRASYVAGRRAYAVNESSAGTNRSGNDVFRQVTSVGNAQRPTAAGSLTINLFPTRTLTIVNHTAASHVRMLGNSYLLQVDRGNDPIVSLPYQFLGIRLVANATDAEYRAKSWLTLHGGYEYSERRIRSQESYGVVPGLIEQSNRLHTATAGLRWRPAKNLTFIADGEVGRADHPIYPISDRNFQAGRARLEYKTKPWRASVFMKLDYNTNSASISNYASQNKQWGADGSWNPRSWFSLDATYAKLSLRTLGALSYFVSPPIQNVTSTTSLYISRVHTATLAAHVSLVKRVDLAIGMSHVQDVGDGRASLPSNPFVAAQTFPLRYTSPMARLSYRITDKIRWNAGYQYYGYAEQFFLKQNYRANTGYSSLSWSF
jgi:hypothetical protein